MAVEWGKWVDNATVSDLGAAGSPYVNWSSKVKDGQDMAQTMTATGMSQPSFETLQHYFGEYIPLPDGVGPNQSQIVDNAKMELPDVAAMVPIDGLQDGDVFVAVIDDSIAPGHVRFLDSTGNTRIHWFWNMGAQFGTQTSDPEKPPFGREYFWSELNSTGDEQATSQTTEVIDFGRADGARGAAMRASHGTHMLDLAAGKRVGETNDDMARMPILAVNLPNRTVRDTSGYFLEFFIINAIQRIVDVADAIWAARFGTDVNPDGHIGFRIAINISFGFTAGPKNGQQILDRYIQNLNRERAMVSAVRSIPQIFFPAGNDYLSRTVAKLSLSPSKAGNVTDQSAQIDNTGAIDWRMVPDDHTSSYLEIWFDEQDRNQPFPDVEVGLASSPQSAQSPQSPQSAQYGGPIGFAQTKDLLRDGQIIGRMTTHRLSCRDAGGDETDVVRPWIHIALAPTYNDFQPDQYVMAGVWELHVKNTGNTSIGMDLYIQRDDTIRAGKTGGRQSYFDYSGFDIYDDFGCLNLSEDDNRIKKSGTINALACLSNNVKNVSVIGAFDKTTMKLAKYNSAGPGFFGAVCQGRSSFDYGAPGDDSPVRSGILAAGSASGGAVAWSGTSTACAIAAGSYARKLISQSPLVGELMLDRHGIGPIAELAHHAKVKLREIER